MNNLVYYPKRVFITVSGADSEQFLQGLITNDIRNINNIIFTAFLTPNGRFLFDFYIWRYQGNYLIDVSSKFSDQLLTKLRLYKIRKEVEININSDCAAAIIFPQIDCDVEDAICTANDPRGDGFATRVLLQKSNIEKSTFNYQEASSDEYHSYRIKNLIAEGDKDLEYEKSIILEYDYNRQNAVSYDKGCYLGQELITRTHRVGVIRKKLVSLILDSSIELTLPYNIEVDGKKKALITSKARYDDKHNIYLALVKDDYQFSTSDL